MTRNPTRASAAAAGAEKAQRKPWTAPRVDRIDAGQAEVGTRAAADGAFSTS